MTNREIVVAVAGVEVFLPVGAAPFTDAEIGEIGAAVDDVDLRRHMRSWLDDHAPALAARVLIRSAD